ncbi:MAG TPA: hypothetical protein VEL76_00385 [Gemmataceae bacterium]|nr:hypothetical protein [Gemmataceae bacterium]
MKSRVLCGLFVLGGLVGSLHAQVPPPPPEAGYYQGPVSDPRARFYDPSSQQDSSRDDEFVKESLSILNETRSSDAFIVTILALHRAGVDGKLLVPAIIRNAERLKLFGDAASDQGTDQKEMITREIMLMLKKPTKKARSTPRPPAIPFTPTAGAAAGALLGAGCGSVASQAEKVDPLVQTNQGDSNPNARMQKLLFESEDLRQIAEEWRRWWMGAQPSPVSPAP